MKLSKEKQNRIAGIILGTLLIVACLYQFAIRSSQDATEQSRTEFDKKQRELEMAQIWLDKGEEIAAELETTSATLQKLERTMASKTDPFAWSLGLIDVAKQGQRIDVREVTRPRIIPVRLFPEFPYQACLFTLRGRAHYHDFGKFIATFENDHPFFRFERIILSNTPEAGQRTTSTNEASELLFFEVDVVALTTADSQQP